MVEEQARLEPHDIGKFLKEISASLWTAARDRKVGVTADQIEGFVLTCLLLARRQPELLDAVAQYWDFTREVDADESVDQLIATFHKSKRQGSKES